MPPFRDLMSRADDPTRCCLLFHVRSVTIAVGSAQFIILSVAVCFFAMGALYGTEQNSYASRWFLASLSGADVSTEMAKQDRQRVAARNDSSYVDSASQATSKVADYQAGVTKRIVVSSSSGCIQNGTNSCMFNATRGSRYDSYGLSDELSGRLVTMCVLSLGVLVTLMLVGGALRRRAALLIPYLCVQLVDLCTTLVNWTAALSGSERRRWLTDHSLLLPDSLVRTRLDALSESSILFLVLLIGSTIIMFKLCWLQCVWNCYKFVVRYRVNEVALHFSSGFDELASTGVGSQRRAPFSVGRISAWRTRFTPAEADAAVSRNNGESEDPELAGLMPPKYEDVVPTSNGDLDRPPTPNYAPPPYCEPCASNSLVDTAPTTLPQSSLFTGEEAAASSQLFASRTSDDATLLSLHAATNDQTLMNEAVDISDDAGDDRAARM